MTFVNIGTALFAIITTVKNASGSKLKEVFNYDMQGPST